MTDTESTRSKPSLRVLEAIVDAEGVSLTSLEPPLNDVVDPAALDRSFEPTSTGDWIQGRHVSFRCRKYDMTIASNGTIELS
ncbi:HalOD1 output domain-containing protein [Haloterrigena salifodinae]|uniref:HalOD1 output domain-containing protein n=1 Tax=Haloterrigena salifodinae TaxID=2675099 RepID=UPI000F89D454|nr:HalOD1 output domain-containing protein [Haloterrigena salifodinae]